MFQFFDGNMGNCVNNFMWLIFYVGDMLQAESFSFNMTLSVVSFSSKHFKCSGTKSKIDRDFYSIHYPLHCGIKPFY